MQTKELRLPLKTKWFDMTKAGIKKEDYREMTAYWMSRLLLLDGKQKNETFWYIYLHKKNYSELREETTFRPFGINTMTLGYPKSGDIDRTLKLGHKGIEIRTGNPEWGAEPGKVYFIIKHGEIINNY